MITLDGYSVMVPGEWEVTEDKGGFVFKEEGKEIGRFDLLYVDHEIVEIPGAFGYTPGEPEVLESDKYAAKLFEVTFKNGEASVIQYIFDDLPGFPPYQAVLTFEDIDKRVASRIVKSFKLPDLGAKPPQKPMQAPDEAFLENAVYTVLRDTTTYAYRLSKLDRLILAGAEQPADEASVLHILSYLADENGRNIKSWFYISVGGGEKKLYTYELGEDGQYFYRNNPKLIREITRQSSKEENYTRYYADDVLLLEAPYNPYLEDKDALLGYKGTLIGDDSNISSLVQKLTPNGTVFEGLSLEKDQKPYGMLIRYVLDSSETYVTDGVLDEKTFYQNALVIFSLVPDVEWISMEVRTGDTIFEVKYERKAAEAQFAERKLSEFTADVKTFEQFTEDVPKMSPPTEENSGNGVDGTRVVYSTVVTIASDRKMPHPRTGIIVPVKPYAERFGVTQYLDKPITVTLYEKTDAGQITMWATGTCEGAEIGSYPISSRAEFDSLLSLVQ
ncbi:MAG: DUF4825 domain-containing protein [Clostridia bacterium]|nr:DUF4825 domain-containing protein [Clostridia bacterium]